MNTLKLTQLEIGNKKGWYMESETLKEILDIKNNQYNKTIDILSRNEKHATNINGKNYVSRYGFDLIVFRHQPQRDRIELVRNMYNGKRDTMTKPKVETFKKGTEKISSRIINNKKHLSSNDMATELQVNPTKFIYEFEKLYKGNMNGVEKLGQDNKGNVVAFLVNENMFDYVINKFEYNQKGYKYIKELYKQVD